MTAGEMVQFRASGRLTVGTLAEVFTAANQRMRARLWFTADGQEWETCRDLTEIQPVDGQLPLFA